jgi:hypothetical protein
MDSRLMKADRQKYLKRLQAMSLAEVAHRMLTAMRDHREFRRLQNGQLNESTEAFLSRLGFHDDLDRALDRLTIDLRKRSLFPWQSLPEENLVEDYQRRFKDNLAATLQTAKNAAEFKFSIFNTPLSFDGHVDWFYDPLLNRSLQLDYWKKIDYYSPDVVKEIKFIWELNRHQHFVTLAKAWFLTHDDDFARALANQWRDWLQKNPYLMGVNWSSALECAFRLISWTWALQFSKNSNSVTADLYVSILRSVEQHAGYISRHLSRYSSANNHILGEALGLIYAGCYYPELAQAGAWREKGFAIFFDQLLAQVHEDGVGREQSVWYQNYVFEFSVLARLAAERTGVSFPENVNLRMEKMAEFLNALDDQGYVPNIGDEDGGTALLLSETEDKNSVRLSAVAAALYNHPDLHRAESEESETAFWLLPEMSIPSSGDHAFSRLRFFPQGGYIIVDQSVGKTAFKLIMDCGPLGLGKMAAHGHADALAVWLSVGGEAVLIDSGAFLYLGAGEERSYFRSTRAHSTICVDGGDSAEQLSSFQWGKRPRVILEEMRESAPIYFRAAHDGYQPIKCVREVEIKQNTLCIRDAVKGVGNHAIDVYFHLAPGNVRQDGNRIICRYSRSRVEFSFESTAAFTISLETAFYSPRFYEKKEHPIIRLSSTAELPVRLTTNIGIYEKN